jgi:hypothetical protein
MTRPAFLLLLALTPALIAQKNKQQLRDPEIQVLEATVRRDEGRITIDARLKNTGEKPARDLRIFYEVLDSDRQVLTRQRGGIEQKDLDPEDEVEVQAQMHFHARAVSVRVEFEDGAGRNLKGTNTGPFVIEE